MSFSVNKYNKIFAFVLCVALLICMVPNSIASAQDTTVPVEENTEVEDFTEISEYCNLNYKECASSEIGKLFVHYESGRFYFEDITGERWYSNPDMADMDSSAGGVYRMELQSLLMIQYYDLETKQFKKANSETSCVRSGGSVSVTNIQGGFVALYDFAKLGFKIPLQITVDKNGVNASIDCFEIVEAEPEKRMLYCISVLPYFGAGSTEEQGYIMIADGSGAIMNFNNGTYSKLGYSSHVYGRDVSKYHISKPAEGYAISMPVFGIKKANSAFCGIVTDGASQSAFKCYPNGSITSYANVYAAFDLRETDVVVLSDRSDKKSELYQKGDISLSKIAVTYRFAFGDDADYNGMAGLFKKYLMEKDNLTVTAQSLGNITFDFYGAVKKKKSILGFPVTVNTALSKIDDINKYIKNFANDGIDDFSVTLRDWSREQLADKIDYSMKPVSAIGNKKQLTALSDTIKEAGGKLNLSVEINSFQKSGRGYFTWFHSAKSLSNSPIYDYEYFVSNASKNKSAGRTSYLIPTLINNMAQRVAQKNKSLYGDVGLSLNNISTTLYSDFNKDNICNLEETRVNIEQAAETFGCSAVDFPADYIIKYTSLAQHIPSTSSKNDIFDRDIPFVQLVLSGLVTYTSEPINLSANPKEAVLEAAALGSGLQYSLITEDAYTIVGTDRDELYNANIEILYDDILKCYNHFAQLEDVIGDGYMVSYNMENHISETTYSNGSVVIVNRILSTVTAKDINGNEYSFSL